MAGAESEQEPLNLDGQDYHDDDQQEDTSALLSSFDEVKDDLHPLLLCDRKQERSRAKKFVIYGISGCLFILALLFALFYGFGKQLTSPTVHNGHNVVVIMADDQDMLLDSMSYMPKTNKLIAEQGLTYMNHYCTVAWCCPSRVNFFTGKAAHNTNVTSTQPPHGGWPKFASQGHNENYLATWIHEAGVRTYYLGKFMNWYGEENMATPACPRGWMNSSMILRQGWLNYYGTRWTNGYTKEVTRYNGIHQTDVIHEKSMEYIEDAARQESPFFMMIAPVAPHQTRGAGAPPIQKKWQGKFDGHKAPRTENWNPDEPSGASWVYNLQKLNDRQIATIDEIHHGRIGNIAGLDDMVGDIVQKLDDLGILDNTYVIYTSDNGFHLGNHRLKAGKRLPYEEDVNIPLLIRGPDVPKNVVTNRTNSHTDMAPTILQMLGIPLREDFDGAPIPYTSHDLKEDTNSEVMTVEFWTALHPPVGFSNKEYYNNTYRAIRLASDHYSFYYAVWCTGEREFYDMKSDSAQMNNRLGLNAKGPGVSSQGVSYYGRSDSELFDRLDALVMVSKSCKQDACRKPWSVMFPGGEVSNLRDAMDEKYDAYFRVQQKVQFERCSEAYFVEEEGPMEIVDYTYYGDM